MLGLIALVARGDEPGFRGPDGVRGYLEDYKDCAFCALCVKVRSGYNSVGFGYRLHPIKVYWGSLSAMDLHLYAPLLAEENKHLEGGEVLVLSKNDAAPSGDWHRSFIPLAEWRVESDYELRGGNIIGKNELKRVLNAMSPVMRKKFPLDPEEGGKANLVALNQDENHELWLGEFRKAIAGASAVARFTIKKHGAGVMFESREVLFGNSDQFKNLLDVEILDYLWQDKIGRSGICLVGPSVEPSQPKRKGASLNIYDGERLWYSYLPIFRIGLKKEEVEAVITRETERRKNEAASRKGRANRE